MHEWKLMGTSVDCMSYVLNNWLTDNCCNCLCVQLDLPLSEVFYKWMLSRERTLQPDDLRHICPVFAKSFMQLTDVLRQKKRIEADKSHVC